MSILLPLLEAMLDRVPEAAWTAVITLVGAAVGAVWTGAIALFGAFHSSKRDGGLIIATWMLSISNGPGPQLIKLWLI